MLRPSLVATFRVWKRKYGQLGVSRLRLLRQLEDENARLKRLVADLTLDKAHSGRGTPDTCDGAVLVRLHPHGC